jgi:hypothetical protein
VRNTSLMSRHGQINVMDLRFSRRWLWDVMCVNIPTFRTIISPSFSGFKSKLSLPPAYAGFLLGLLFDREDGGEISLRNVELSRNDTVLQPRKPHSS